MPGFGSLMAGRRVGYPQAALGLIGLAVTTLFAARFFAWYLVQSGRLQGDEADPFAKLAELWSAVRWPLLGVVIFLLGWAWSLITSLQILWTARQAEAAAQPPRLPV
jgi:hypothetical protein